MMVSGIYLVDERPPAVAVPPVVIAQTLPTATASGGAETINASAASTWQQHPNPFDQTSRQRYDMHARIAGGQDTTGTRFDRWI